MLFVQYLVSLVIISIVMLHEVRSSYPNFGSDYFGFHSNRQRLPSYSSYTYDYSPIDVQKPNNYGKFNALTDFYNTVGYSFDALAYDNSGFQSYLRLFDDIPLKYEFNEPPPPKYSSYALKFPSINRDESSKSAVQSSAPTFYSSSNSLHFPYNNDYSNNFAPRTFSRTPSVTFIPPRELPRSEPYSISGPEVYEYNQPQSTNFGPKDYQPAAAPFSYPKPEVSLGQNPHPPGIKSPSFEDQDYINFGLAEASLPNLTEDIKSLGSPTLSSPSDIPENYPQVPFTYTKEELESYGNYDITDDGLDLEFAASLSSTKNFSHPVRSSSLTGESQFLGIPVKCLGLQDAVDAGRMCESLERCSIVNECGRQRLCSCINPEFGSLCGPLNHNLLLLGERCFKTLGRKDKKKTV